MTKLSVCIPVEAGMSPPEHLVRQLLADETSSIEVIVSASDQPTSQALAETLEPLAGADGRLRLVALQDDNLSSAQFWISTLAHATGEWVSIIGPQDMLEPELPKLLAFIEDEVPGADAVGWSAFSIDPETPRDVPSTVVLPVLHNVNEMDKTRMLQAFFHWEGAQRTPVMPFGLHHGAVKRTLVESILAGSGELSWLTLAPRWEWSARVLIFANTLAFSNRPLSAINAEPFRMADVPSALLGFPFDARLGITAVIAEIQARVLHELGGQWAGFDENFVRACLYDCAMEHDRSAFMVKAQRYREALRRMPGGQELSAGFQPQYLPHLPPDNRRGRVGVTLFVNRFIGNARTAQDFYAVMSSLMTPIPIVIDASLRSKNEAVLRPTDFAGSAGLPRAS